MIQDMTSGNPLRHLLVFTMPILVGNVFQLLYNTVDSLVVGRYIGPLALAAVSNANAVMFLLLGFFWGLPHGLSIITGQRFGAHDMDGIKRSAATSIAVNGFFTLLIMGIALVYLRSMLRMLSTPAEIFEDSYKYLLIIFLGLPTMSYMCLFAGQIRALGDSRTPLYISIICAVINAVLDWYFVCRFNWGVPGVAWATVIAQLCFCLLCIAVIWWKTPLLFPQRNDWAFKFKEYWEHVSLSFPMGLQFSIIAIGALVLQGAINTLGADKVSAFGIGSRIEAIAAMPMIAVGMAISAFVAQNYGAKRYDRVFFGVSLSIRMMEIFAFVLGVIVVIFTTPLTELFIGNDYPDIVYLVMIYFSYTVPGYFMLGLIFIFRQSLSGLGHSGVILVGGLVEVFTRIWGAVYLVSWFGFYGASVTTAFTWVANALFMGVAYCYYRRKLLGSSYGKVNMSFAKHAKNTFMNSEKEYEVGTGGKG